MSFEQIALNIASKYHAFKSTLKYHAYDVVQQHHMHGESLSTTKVQNFVVTG